MGFWASAMTPLFFVPRCMPLMRISFIFLARRRGDNVNPSEKYHIVLPASGSFGRWFHHFLNIQGHRWTHQLSPIPEHCKFCRIAIHPHQPSRIRDVFKNYYQINHHRIFRRSWHRLLVWKRNQVGRKSNAGRDRFGCSQEAAPCHSQIYRTNDGASCRETRNVADQESA